MFSQYGIEYEEDKAIFTRRLDHQREQGKGIYGSGYIVPLGNARRAQEERRRAQEENAQKWILSERELKELKELKN